MPKLDIQGFVIHKSDVIVKNGKYAEQVLIVKESVGTYPNTFPITFKNDDTNTSDDILVGSEVKVSAFINGIGYNDKTTGDPRSFIVIAYDKIEVLSAPKQEKKAKQQSSNPPPTQSAPAQSSQEEDEDLPF